MYEREVVPTLRAIVAHVPDPRARRGPATSVDRAAAAGHCRSAVRRHYAASPGAVGTHHRLATLTASRFYTAGWPELTDAAPAAAQRQPSSSSNTCLVHGCNRCAPPGISTLRASWMAGAAVPKSRPIAQRSNGNLGLYAPGWWQESPALAD